jgi:hypothetical protein
LFSVIFMLPPGSRPRLSDLTPEQLRQRAREYRSMAEGASTARIRDALERLADRFDELADSREGDNPAPERDVNGWRRLW